MIFPCPSSLKRRCKMACDCCLFKFLCSVKGKHVSRYKRKTFVFKFLQWVGPMTKINKSLRYLYYQCNVLRVWAGYYSPADTVHVPGTVPNNPGRPLLTFSSSFNAYFLKELIFFLSIFFSFFYCCEKCRMCVNGKSVLKQNCMHEIYSVVPVRVLIKLFSVML